MHHLTSYTLHHLTFCIITNIYSLLCLCRHRIDPDPSPPPPPRPRPRPPPPRIIGPLIRIPVITDHPSGTIVNHEQEVARHSDQVTNCPTSILATLHLQCLLTFYIG